MLEHRLRKDEINGRVVVRKVFPSTFDHLDGHPGFCRHLSRRCNRLRPWLDAERAKPGTAQCNRREPLGCTDIQCCCTVVERNLAANSGKDGFDDGLDAREVRQRFIRFSQLNRQAADSMESAAGLRRRWP